MHRPLRGTDILDYSHNAHSSAMPSRPRRTDNHSVQTFTIHDAQTSTYNHPRCTSIQYSLTSTMHRYYEYSHLQCTDINYSHTSTIHRYHKLARTLGLFTSARPWIGLIRNEFEPPLPSQPSFQNSRTKYDPISCLPVLYLSARRNFRCHDTPSHNSNIAIRNRASSALLHH
jgi:hypothetical protein